MTADAPPADGGTAIPPGIFVLCTARSGSTLLRYLLDAHPDVACPPETPVGQLCRTLNRVWQDVAGAGPASGPDGRVLARGAFQEVMRQYLAQHGKQRWCDKSLQTVMNLPDITATFPDAAYLCLYRHAMDMIASGLEASRWGYGHFGFRGHVERHPDNIVAALAEYWADRTRRILDLERAGRHRTLRLTYESLASRPRETLESVCEFLGLQRDDALLEQLVAGSLAADHSAGLQDYKIGFSSAIHGDSLGRGRSVPVRKLEGGLRQRVNELLEELGYAVIDDDWNTGHGLPRADLAPPPAAAARRPVAALLEVVARRLAEDRGPRPAGGALRVTDITGGQSYLHFATAQRSHAAPEGGAGIWATNSVVLGQLVQGQLDVAQAARWELLRRSAAGTRRADSARQVEERLLGRIFRGPEGLPLD
jgi:Sulfotransferase family